MPKRNTGMDTKRGAKTAPTAVEPGSATTAGSTVRPVPQPRPRPIYKHPFQVRLLGSAGELLLKRTVDAANDPGFDPSLHEFPDAGFVLQQFHVDDIYVVSDSYAFHLFKVAEIRPRDATGKFLSKLLIIQEGE